MKTFKLLVLCVLSAFIVGCGTTSSVPITGRKQTLMVSDGEVLSLSTQQYQEFMKTAKTSSNATNTAMVKRVGQKLASAVTSYLNANGMSADVQNFAWEFNLVKDASVNAWCMPGGKIVVYEGLLPVTQDEASLAIVLGHEIAHAVARHSAEQLSTQYVTANKNNNRPSDHPSDETRIKNITAWMPEALKYYKGGGTTTTATTKATTKSTSTTPSTTKTLHISTKKK